MQLSLSKHTIAAHSSEGLQCDLLKDRSLLQEICHYGGKSAERVYRNVARNRGPELQGEVVQAGTSPFGVQESSHMG